MIANFIICLLLGILTLMSIVYILEYYINACLNLGRGINYPRNCIEGLLNYTFSMLILTNFLAVCHMFFNLGLFTNIFEDTKLFSCIMVAFILLYNIYNEMKFKLAKEESIKSKIKTILSICITVTYTELLLNVCNDIYVREVFWLYEMFEHKIIMVLTVFALTTICVALKSILSKLLFYNNSTVIIINEM